MYAEHRQTGGLFDLHISCSWNTLQHLSDLLGGLVHHIHVIAKHFHCDVTAYAGDQLVEAHLNGLSELIVVAGNLFNRLLHRRNQIGFAAIRIGPLVARL